MLKIEKRYLPDGQYIKAPVKKQNIILHHTVSSNADSPWRWWASTPERVATAYIVAKDGTVTECFDPSHWAYHLGMKHPRNTEFSRRSVGIEIVNEGQVRRRGDLWEWNFLHGAKPGIYRGEVVEAQPWRGFSFWAAYAQEQYEAVGELCGMLCDRFGIARTVCDSLSLDLTAPDRFGVCSHRNLVASKFDLSPAFDFQKFKF